MLKRLHKLVTTSAVSHARSENRAAVLAGRQITYILKRSSRRRSIGLRVNDRGLTVSMPLRASESWLHSVLQDKADWVLEKLDDWQARKPPEQDWQDGEFIPYLGEQLTLRLVAGGWSRSDRDTPDMPLRSKQGAHGATIFSGEDPRDFAGIRGVNAATVLHGDALHVCVRGEVSSERIERKVVAWYRQQAMALYTARVAHYAALMQVAPREIKLSSAKKQWGSCSARGTVRLNLQLIKLPLHLLDYVVVHELAHLREMNHSAAFWAVVASACPDYDKRRRELKGCSL